jgi:aldose 1-epimerase
VALTGRQFDISAGPHRASVVEVGAGLRRYTCDGRPVTGSYAEDVLPPKGCGIALVPWPNRLRNGRYTFDGTEHQLPLTEPAAGNAIHGLGRWVRWTPVVHTRAKVTLGLDIVPQTGYPFEVRAEVTYALHRDRGLTVTATARNDGSVRAPFGAGFHPYLDTGGRTLERTTVQLPVSTRLVVDDKKIPVATEPVRGTSYDLRRGRRLGGARFDDGFTDVAFRDGRAVARVGDTQLWVDEKWQYLQVFTLDDLGGAPAVAIEPMTCAPDAFNSGAGLIVLEPGETWTGSWGITPRTDR